MSRRHGSRLVVSRDRKGPSRSCGIQATARSREKIGAGTRTVYPEILDREDGASPTKEIPRPPGRSPVNWEKTAFQPRLTRIGRREWARAEPREQFPQDRPSPIVGTIRLPELGSVETRIFRSTKMRRPRVLLPDVGYLRASTSVSPTQFDSVASSNGRRREH